MALAVVYDPRFHTFESWASIMCEAYAGQQLPIPMSQANWKDWAYGLKAIDVFMNEGIPSPDIYDDWHDWAAALVGAVNQPTEGADQ